MYAVWRYSQEREPHLHCLAEDVQDAQQAWQTAERDLTELERQLRLHWQEAGGSDSQRGSLEEFLAHHGASISYDVLHYTALKEDQPSAAEPFQRYQAFRGVKIWPVTVEGGHLRLSP